MPTLLDYAALSAMVYNDRRYDDNKLLPDPPAGWTTVLDTSNAGFTAATKGVRDEFFFERQAHAVM